MKKEKKIDTVAGFLEMVEEEMGEQVLFVPKLNKSVRTDIESIPTGLSELDRVLGVGGIPYGKITEIMGSEASGKTTLALHVIAEAQQRGIECAFIDTEQAIDGKRAEKIGVDFDTLAVSQPDSAEEALDLLELIVRSGVFRLVVIDSVAALTPKAEIEGDMSDATMGLQARLMGKILRKIVAPANKFQVAVVFINQVRHKIGGFMPFPMEVTSGGNALKYYASLRIDMRKTGTSRTKEEYSIHKITVKKNKLAAPMKVIEGVKIGEKGFVV